MLKAIIFLVKYQEREVPLVRILELYKEKENRKGVLLVGVTTEREVP